MSATWVACGAMIALAVVEASAQSVSAADPSRTPGWVLTPTVSASSAWDDNVMLAGDGAPRASDQVTLLSGNADGQYQGRHHSVSFGYAGTFSAYRLLSRLNSYDQRLRVDSKHALSRRVTLTLHDGLSFVPTTDAVDLSGIPFLRTGSRLEDARAALSVEVGPRATVGGGYAFEWVAFDRDNVFARYLKGGHSHGGFGSVAYQVAKRWTAGASFSFRRALLGENGGRFDIADSAGSVTYRATSTLTLSGSLGVSFLNRSATAADLATAPGDARPSLSQRGPSWSFSASKRFARGTADASYVRSYVPSFGLGGTLQNEELDANVHMPFARNRLFWQVGVSWRRNEPLAPGEAPLRSLWLQTSAGYSFERWLRLEAYYWRSQQDSQLAGGRVDRNRVGVQVVTATPMRFR